MTRNHILALAALAALLPAVVLAGSYYSASSSVCFANAGTAYRLTDKSYADFTIRIDNQAATPDLSMQIVNNAAAADFVLVGDSENDSNCRNAVVTRTIHIDNSAHDPDLTIAVTPAGEPAQFKVYAHDAAFSPQDAAALFAVMRKMTRKREYAARH